jgi:hypothetical protein
MERQKGEYGAGMALMALVDLKTGEISNDGGACDEEHV